MLFVNYAYKNIIKVRFSNFQIIKHHIDRFHITYIYIFGTKYCWQ